ncbi:hypothetical protein [Erythrobacter crassostreae]|uniref:Uncharacterized protein n=1 Tax=Erythrobacter crassostreae TaxID=2828328 RepID=A0A9X1JPZ5_9SPHN|nr:hypothetical protein [Erythrobacter crassostrea]MBV7259942.1 hypothetical protein [Erythrobacter crassostrea]
MTHLDGYEDIPFPFEKLSPQEGELTWIKEFEDSLIEGAVLEFPILHAELPGDLTDWTIIDRDRGTTLSLEATLPFRTAEDLAGSEFRPERENLEAFTGSVYLGDRHHLIDLHRIAFEKSGEGLIVTCDCLVALTNEGLGAGDDIEYDDTEWSFSAPLSVKEQIHNYRAGKSPTIAGRVAGMIAKVIGKTR